MEANRTSYIYEPLDQSNSSIRLITLQPSAEFEAEIHCSIFNVSLDTKPKYEALSYTWGDDSITQTIFLQHHPFQATVNLVSALRHLRLKDQPRTLWVDAICIDQANIPEIEQQIPFMRNIYSIAELDLLWLGEDPHKCADPAFEFLRYVRKVYDGVYDVYQPKSTVSEDARSCWDKLPTLLSEDQINVLKKVLHDPPVWQRIWIVQEIAMARHVQVHFGFYSIPWEVLQSFSRALYQFRSTGAWIPGKDQFKSLAPFRILVTTRDSFQEFQEYQPILDLWDTFKDSLAKNPRDKIFALLGLADDASRAIIPDYTRSTEEVFTKIAQTTISQTGTLDCLCLGHLKPQFTKTLDLPSWVVNFGDHEESISRGGNTFDIGEHEYKASGSTTCSSVTLPSTLATPPSLLLRGIMLDTIIEKFEVESFDPTGSGWKELVGLIRKLPEWIFEDGEAKDQYRGVDTLANTLTAGIVRRAVRKPAKTEDIKEFGDALSRIRSTIQKAESSEELVDETIKDDTLELLLRSMLSINSWYDFCVTKGEFMAMVPSTVLQGDVIVILYGSRIPHVLRPVADGKEGTFELVGMAYVHGYMYGEAIGQRDAGVLKEEAFVLV